MTDRTPYWTLDDDGNPQPCDDVLKWGQWFEGSIEKRRVSEDRDEGPGADDVRISTVFLALDHSWRDGPPMLYETLVFGGVLDGEMYRCSTREEAVLAHQVMCQRVREAQKLGRRDDDGT
jgi:hypothetical protein